MMTSVLVEAAARDLRATLKDGPVEMHEALARMASIGHPPDRTQRAKRALGVRTPRTGPVGTKQTFKWELPTRCPTCGRAYVPDAWAHTLTAPTTDPGVAGVDQEQDTPIEQAPFRRLDLGPVRCTVCGKAWALDPGQRCIAPGCRGVLG
jgi:hypothetical protein